MKQNNTIHTKPSVSIGTAALNEENMIGEFLHSILTQRVDSYVLESIFVISDGSTDRTVQIAKSFKDKRIHIFDNKTRKGRTYRIKELCKKNTSDILIVLDADMLLKTRETIEHVVQAFKENNTGMVGLNVQPIRSQTIMGKLLYIWEKVWLDIREHIHEGNTIYSLRGGAFAIKGMLLKKIAIPDSMHQLAEYFYHYTLSRGLQFTFAREAVALYRQPETFADYLSALSRGDSSDILQFEQLFGKKVYAEYVIPIKTKYSILLKNIFRSPFKVLTALTFVQTAKIMSKNKNNLDKRGFWPVTKSTKKKFTIYDA